MATVPIGGRFGSEVTYDRAALEPADNALDVHMIGGNTTLNIVNTTYPGGATSSINLQQIMANNDGSTHTVNLAENTNVHLTTIPYYSAYATFNYNLGANSSLLVDGGNNLDHMMNSWDSFNFNFSEDGPATLTFGHSVFGPKDTYLNAPTLSGFKAGDSLIVSDAKSAEFSDQNLIFKNADGKIVFQLNAPEVDETLLRFDTDDTGAMTVGYACYLRGTHIATPEGETKVENLQAGDQVLTASGGIAKVKWLGYRALYKNRIPEKDAKRAFPILFKKGCIADNVPHRDLVMSPGHHVFFDGNLVPAMVLVNGISIVQQFEMQSFQYFHVELEQFDILLAEGVPAESYVDTGNRNMFQNAHEVAMNPDFGPTEGRPDVPGITVVRKGPVLEAIRARLLERANWMQVPEAQKRVG